MGWNPYQDQKNRAYSNILTSLFPEQTKTIPRIIVWSFIFLADLIIAAGFAFSLGLLEQAPKLAAALLIAVSIAAFWLQGVIWGMLCKLFKKLFTKKEETWL